ncbi:hypothetical protein ACQJBY_030425 [Aegilops geniculata]
MEGKAILLCLMVLVHLGNSIHIDKCKDLVHPQRKICKDLAAAYGRECVLSKCQVACRDLFGAEFSVSWCSNVVPYYWHCMCRVCFRIALNHHVEKWTNNVIQ